MKCGGIQKRLSEYVDGRLPEQTARAIDEHCASCASCARELASLRAYRDAMSSLSRKSAPADFLRKINERLDTAEPAPARSRRLLSPRRLRLSLEAAGLLAAAALVFVILVPDEARKADRASEAPESLAVSDAEVMKNMAPIRARDKTRRAEGRRIADTASGDSRLYVINFSSRRFVPSADASEETRRERTSEFEGMKASEAPADKAKVAAARQMPPTEEKKEAAAVRAVIPSPGDIRSIVRRAGGTILDEDCDASTGACRSITFEIRPEGYALLVSELKGLGEVRPQQRVPKEGVKNMRLRIQVDGE